jgi:hypothetical protein
MKRLLAGLLNRFKFAARTPHKVISVDDVQRAWNMHQPGWYSRASMTSRQEQAFALLDELHAFSIAGEFNKDFHIMQAFGVSAEAKDGMLEAWNSDRTR